MNVELQETSAAENVIRRPLVPEDNPNPIVELDLGRKVFRYVNPAASMLFSDFEFADFDHPFLAGVCEAAKPLTEGLAKHVRREIAFGERCYFQDLVYNRQSDAVRVYAIDVTDIKRLESHTRMLNIELQKTIAEHAAALAAKSKELENLSYLVSHDLKAPLRGIDGYSRLLAEEYSDKLDDEGRRFVKNIRAATLHMVQLIDDLLAYSKVERRVLALDRIDLRRFVEDQLTQRRDALGSVTVDIAEISVFADPALLAIVLQQILDNAVKFSKKTGAPAIAICAQTTGRRCRLTVQDQGIGFDMRHHDKIFGIFQKLHRVEEFPGTGIGLALVRKALERMDGKIWAESRPDSGSTFFFELPLGDGLSP